MKKPSLYVAAGILAFLAGCGPKQTVVLLDQVPEIDHSAIDQLVDYKSAEISEDRLFIVVRGIAKANMGLSRGVRVQRYTNEGMLDTIAGSIQSSKEVPQPEKPPPDPNRDPNVMPPRPPMPPPLLIEEGGPVHVTIDATMSGGRITKLVITPGPPGPTMMLPEGPEPGSVPTTD